jgi:hypothetical protein
MCARMWSAGSGLAAQLRLALDQWHCRWRWDRAGGVQSVGFIEDVTADVPRFIDEVLQCSEAPFRAGLSESAQFEDYHARQTVKTAA